MGDEGYLRSGKWMFWFTVLVMVLTTIPYLLGFISQGEEWRFTGFLFGVEDGNSYIAKMQAGAAGEWLFRSPYTNLEQKGVIAFFPYILLGKFAVFPISKHSQLILFFHLFRILAGAAMIFATYDFLGIYLKQERWKRWALIAITLGGGMGWIILFFDRARWLGSVPLEFTSPESFGFLMVYGLPHLAFARALLLWSLKAFVVEKRMIKTGLMWLLMTLFQPLNVYLAWAVSGIYILLNTFLYLRKEVERRVVSGHYLLYIIRRYLSAVTISAPLVVYITIRFFTDEYLRSWTAQNRITSPHIVHYLIAYGLIFPLIIPGVSRILREHPRKSWLVLGWIGLFPILISLPIVVQRRLADGIWVVLVLTATKAFSSKYEPISPRWAYPGMLLFPSLIFLLAGGVKSATQPALPLFRTSGEVQTFEYIASHVPENSIVLSSHRTGNALPAWAPVHVVLGHSPETPDFEVIKTRVRDFYSQEMPDHARRTFLSRHEVDYVYWGPYEQQLGNWEPMEADFLSLYYRDKDFVIFQTERQ